MTFSSHVDHANSRSDVWHPKKLFRIENFYWVIRSLLDFGLATKYTKCTIKVRKLRWVSGWELSQSWTSTGSFLWLRVSLKKFWKKISHVGNFTRISFLKKFDSHEGHSFFEKIDLVHSEYFALQQNLLCCRYARRNPTKWKSFDTCSSLSLGTWTWFSHQTYIKISHLQPEVPSIKSKRVSTPKRKNSHFGVR